MRSPDEILADRIKNRHVKETFASETFYDGFHRLPYRLRRKLSCHDLDCIYKECIKPVLDELKSQDKGIEST